MDTSADDEPSLEFADLVIEPAARRASIRGEEMALKQREFELLLFLARHPGRAFTREELMDQVWRYAFHTDTSTVTVHVRRLRTRAGRRDLRGRPGVACLDRRSDARPR